MEINNMLTAAIFPRRLSPAGKQTLQCVELIKSCCRESCEGHMGRRCRRACHVQLKRIIKLLSLFRMWQPQTRGTRACGQDEVPN